MSEIETFANREALFEAAASALVNALTAGIAARGAASLALAGGSTPAPVYRLLSQAELEWSKVTVTLTDERMVAPDHPDSNERMLRQTLLTGPASKAVFAPLEEGAVAAMTPFDGVLLGMGEDGHFASLFPGNAALAAGLAGDALTIEVPAGELAPPQPRSSLTLKALTGASATLLLVTGAAKRAVLENVDGLPVAALIETAQPRILWAD
jgi:6-phosphogluconolactonase